MSLRPAWALEVDLVSKTYVSNSRAYDSKITFSSWRYVCIQKGKLLARYLNTFLFMCLIVLSFHNVSMRRFCTIVKYIYLYIDMHVTITYENFHTCCMNDTCHMHLRIFIML